MADRILVVSDEDARVLARILGQRGGKKTSPKKTAAVRLNAKRPRPNRRKKPATEAA